MNLCHFPLLPTTHLPHLLRQKVLHLLFLWQFELVFGDKELVIHTSQSILDQGVIFLGAKQDANRKVVAVGHNVLFVPAYIGVELSNMLVAKLVHFEFNQDMALENAGC